MANQTELPGDLAPDPVSVLLTLVLAHDASRHEVVVEADTSVTWAALRPHLAGHLALPDEVYAGADQLTDDALLGHPPLVHGAQLTDRPGTRPAAALLELAVAEGPDAGAVNPVTTPHLRIGRGPGNDVPISDPDLSRAHTLMEITHGEVRLTDLSSTNGTRIDGERIDAFGAEVKVGQRVTAGRTTLRLQPAAVAPPTLPTAQPGRRAVHRAPREPIRLPRLELDLPRRPHDDEQQGLPWLMVLIPIPLSLVLALAFQSMFMLAFGLMSPLLMLGQYVHDRRSGKVSLRVRMAEYDVEHARVRQRAEDAIAAAVIQRRRIAPDLAELRTMAAAARVWPRRPRDADYLWWRVGTGAVDLGISLRDAERETTPQTGAACPVTLSLAEHPVVGLSGPDDLRTRAAQSLLGQVACLHSPLFVRVVIIVPDVCRRVAWQWARRLPHLSPTASSTPHVLVAGLDDGALSGLLADESTAPEKDWRQDRPPVRTVVILDGASLLARHPLVSGLLRHGLHHGVAVVALDGTRDHLPPDCQVTVELSAPTHGRLRGAMEQDFIPDLPTHGWALSIAEHIVPMVDATPSAQDAEPPSAARLLDVLEIDATDGPALADAWTTTRRTTRAVLGVGADGAVTVDLATDGPHALVGGTTGSGKSELLQTLIASLAVGNRPDEMVFVLVDYKGGAAFKDCARLPHTVGLVTDLDAHLTQRALTSLEAEIARRERLLGAAGAKDLEDYQSLSAAAEQPLPRLMLVIDEFRVLAEELPDFIEGLVRIAAVGRSLGIHLVLATQRPAGVVSTDIRANVNLRIALRVRDIGDSEDVIGAPDAARISTSTPGRAILRSASSPTITMQAARVGGHGSEAAGTIAVRPVDPASGRVLALQEVMSHTGPTDLQQLVDSALEATDTLGIAPVASPWLPSLPDLCTLDQLPAVCRPVGSLDTVAPADHPGLARTRVGLIDLPQKQQQNSLVWELQGGHLAIVGGPRSGKTTALRTLCTDLATSLSADELHLYVLDTSGGLQVLDQLPHVGAVLRREDLSRGAGLISWLVEEIASRQAVLAQEHHADLAEHRLARAMEGREALPRILVAVDGWEIFTEEYEAVDNGRIVEAFQEVLRDGLGVGVHVLLSGGRGLLSSRVSSSVSHRLCLRMTDEMDLLMAGLRPAQVPSTMPAGRALLLPDGEEVQLTLLAADPAGQAQAAAVTAAAKGLSPAQTTPPRRFEGLPDSIDLSAVVDQTRDLRHRPLALLGVGGEDAQPLGIDLDPVWGLTALVCGPARSGRTNALLVLSDQLVHRGPVLWVTGGGAPPSLPDGAAVLSWDDPAALWAHLEPNPDTVLVLDDLDEIFSDQVEDMALEHLRRCRGGRGAVLAAGTTADLGSAFRGVAHELRRRQSGLILQPGRHDGEVLGVRLPQTHRPQPGRGALVLRGQVCEIQVATHQPVKPPGAMERRADLPASA